MKNKKTRILAVSLAATGVLLCSPGAFATNEYGMEYSGGEPLGADNVQIEPGYVSSLTKLLEAGVVDTTFDDSEVWYGGYIKDNGGVCKSTQFYTIPFSLPRGLYYGGHHITFSNDKYRAELSITNEIAENVSDMDAIPIGVVEGSTYIYVGWQVYADNTCEERATGVTPLRYNEDSRVFLEMNVKLYEKDSETPYNPDKLFFGLTDIDAAQSYKILNEDSLLTPGHMFAKSAGDLQSQDPSVTFRNMYVPSGNYIYSEYDPATGSRLETDNISNIYAELGSNTKQNGLSIVFGFAGYAASGIEFYAEPYKVQYTADPNGSITGITGEEVDSGNNPQGSSYRPNKNYAFRHWVANVGVTLVDGTTIEAGSPITSEQIKQVVVNQNIVFTAIFETTSEPEDGTSEDELPEDEAIVAVPDTGSSTAGASATQITVSAIGILLGALLIRSLPRIIRKKIDFGE